MKIEVLAFAKINLILRILRRREDGYHEIDSIVQTIDLADLLTVEPARGVQVENDLTDIDGEDLAALAARAVLRRKPGAEGVRITVKKGIPAGAGLGGGSSDAAAVIRAVDRLFPPRLSPEELLSVAAEVGSDVPLFLYGGRLRMRGRGEVITRIDAAAEESFLLLVPPLRSDTGRVYRRWRPGVGGRASDAGLGANDLLSPALSIYPELVAYHRAVDRLDSLYAGMSGSGASFYAAFADPDSARGAAGRLRREFPRALVFVCSPTEEGHRITRGGSG